jgi:hypothetical protein
MSGDQALGVVSLAIGLALLCFQTRIVRAWSERDEEELRKPLQRAMMEYWQARVPSWMRGAAFRRIVHRAWLTGVAVLFVYAGVRLVTG